MQLSETLFRISCRLPHGRGLSDLPEYEWQKDDLACSMLELISSKLCTNDFVTWPQYTFGLSLFVVSIRRFNFSGVFDSATSSIPSSSAVVQTDAREPTDVLANALRVAMAEADVTAQVVVVVFSPLPVCRISVKRIFRTSPLSLWYGPKQSKGMQDAKRITTRVAILRF